MWAEEKGFRANQQGGSGTVPLTELLASQGITRTRPGSSSNPKNYSTARDTRVSPGQTSETITPPWRQPAIAAPSSSSSRSDDRDNAAEPWSKYTNWKSQDWDTAYVGTEWDEVFWQRHTFDQYWERDQEPPASWWENRNYHDNASSNERPRKGARKSER